MHDRLIKRRESSSKQTPLPVSQPGDAAEVEATRVASDVMAVPDGAATSRQTTTETHAEAASASGGQPLDHATRRFFEPRFGHDFGQIRVHADESAARSADAFAAKAYTIGSDIVFAAGQYAPDSHSGRRLIAHELTHTIQQASGAPPAIQREPNTSTAPPNYTPAGPNSTPAGPPMSVAPPGSTPPPVKTVTYKGKTLQPEAGAAKKMLQDMIATDGYKATIVFLDDLASLPGRSQDFHNAFKSEETDAANTCISTTTAQREPLEKERNALLDDFEAKARARTNQILDESEKRIHDERKRYGIPDPSVHHDPISGSDTIGIAKEMADNEATKEMAAAAAEMVPPRRNLESLIKQYDACYESAANNNSLPGVNPKRVIPGKEPEVERLGPLIEQAKHEVNVLRAQNERKAPILATYGPEGEANTDSLENIARGTASTGWKVWKKNAVDELVPMIAEKLQNINSVRKSLEGKHLNIWSNQTIVTGAKTELGYAPTSWQGKVVDEKVKEVHDEEFLVNLFVAVVAIGLGLVAIFATAGTATAAVAAVGSGVLSTAQAVNSLSNYSMAMAESGTDFDKSRAISQDDPSLAWLALDLIGAALDFKAALSAFKVLGPAIREALAAGKSAESLEKLGIALDKYPPGVKAKVLTHIAKAEDIGKPALEQMEKAARAQYKSLSDAGRLGEIGNVSEDVFVKQMLASGKTHIIIAGEEGVRRTSMVTALMQPGNERLTAILKGDLKAIDGLIVEHGNWKQLVGMLEQGTPEMRQASAKLFERRQSLLAQLESKFNAKPVSGASTEKISDIDLSTYGADAGNDMIKAEEHMKSLYGPGWSEALRMNFYTEAGRLTLYEKVMPGLSKAEQAKLLGDITADAEKLNVAKMLAHAEGNPARVAEVEAYAKKMGVDVNDPKIKELVPKLAGGGDVAARNKLLLEIDALTKQANAATPGSPEHIDLVKRITSKQMEANALTAEAYIGPGAGRMTVSGVKVIGHEAYQAAMSNLEMIQHILHETGPGTEGLVVASREYEIYKYINRFAEAAESAGAKTQGLDYWKNFSGFASKTDRQATSAAAHLGPHSNATVPKGGQPFLPDANPTIGPVTDQFLQQQYDAWKAFSQEAIGDVKKIAQENPGAWSQFNAPRPAAGTPATP